MGATDPRNERGYSHSAVKAKVHLTLIPRKDGTQTGF